MAEPNAGLTAEGEPRDVNHPARADSASSMCYMAAAPPPHSHATPQLDREDGEATPSYDDPCSIAHRLPDNPQCF